MNIFYHEKAQEFYLQNESVSYIMKVLKNGQIGQLYYGSAIPDKEDFTYWERNLVKESLINLIVTLKSSPSSYNKAKE